ncbi:MAG: hypothetical protein J7577_17140 [Sphingobacteriaceae bacterium]|nr:hypothetical protein [Sphingobacteriaceae bacterium]
MRKAYNYFFYKLYKFWDLVSTPKFISDWKAELTIDILEIFLGLSIIVYYTVITKEWIDFGNEKYIIIVYLLFVAVPNYFIFHHRNQWKQIVHEFDQWPKKKNKIGGMIVFIIILAVVGNLIFAFYQMSLVDWSQYR